MRTYDPHTHIYTHPCACIYIYRHICIYIYVYTKITHTQCISAYVYGHGYGHVDVYVYVYVHVHDCVYVHVYVHYRLFTRHRAMSNSLRELHWSFHLPLDHPGGQTLDQTLTIFLRSRAGKKNHSNYVCISIYLVVNISLSYLRI